MTINVNCTTNYLFRSTRMLKHKEKGRRKLKKGSNKSKRIHKNLQKGFLAFVYMVHTQQVFISIACMNTNWWLPHFFDIMQSEGQSNIPMKLKGQSNIPQIPISGDIPVERVQGVQDTRKKPQRSIDICPSIREDMIFKSWKKNHWYGGRIF